MSKVQYRELHTTVDSSTGQVLQTEEFKTIRLESEPEFVKLYLADIMLLKNLPKYMSGILHQVLKYMNFKNEIIIVGHVKSQIADELQIKVGTIEKAIHQLAKEGILIAKSRGLYIANPQLFGKGKWEDIQKLRLSLTYDKHGRQISFERDMQTTLELVPTPPAP